MKNWQYISAAGLKSLDNYGYHGVDNSFLGNNVLCHWWNFFINFFPMTMAPNLITLIGFIANIVSYLLYVYYCPTLTEVAPWYIYFVVGLLIFFYQSMDNIDGKQARRTKSSSPLGELFDHVCDASSLVLLISCIIVSLRAGKTVLMISFVLTSTQFYLTHWEEYFTGVLLMGKWDGPTEGQILIIFINFLQGFFVLIGHPDFWITQLGAGIRPVDIFVSIYVINSILSIKQVILRTFEAMKKKGTDFNSSILVLSPFTLFLVLCTIWYVTCNGRLSDMQMRLYFNSVSVIFGYLTSRLIVQRICHEKCVIFYPILIPLAIIVLNNLLYYIGLNLFSHLTGTWIMFWLSLAQFIIFSVSIIQQLTAYLKINCFTIPPVPVDTK